MSKRFDTRRGNVSDVLTSNGYVLDESSRRLGHLEPVPLGERHDRDTLWRRLRRDGYLWLRGVLDAATVDDFRAFYFGKVSGIAEADRARMRAVLFGEIVPSPQYEAFCTQPAIRGFYGWLFGGDVHLHRRKIIRQVRPGQRGIGLATQAHYDLVYLREGTDGVLSSWIPLGDCPPERGGLVYLEGSHHRTLAEERSGRLRRPAASLTADLPRLAAEYDSRWLVADYLAGDMVVHSAYIVHASLDNSDPAGVTRLSTDIRYQRDDQPIDERWQRHWRDDDGL